MTVSSIEVQMKVSIVSKNVSILMFVICFLLIFVLRTVADPKLEKGTVEVTLSPKEQAELTHNWELAYRLADYDRYSWIASDSVLAYIANVDTSAMDGWIVVGDFVSCEVIFGRLSDSGLISPAQVHFSDGMPTSPSIVTKCYPTTSEAYLGFRALLLMETRRKRDLEKDNIGYNSYVLFDGDTISVYYFPGSTEEYLAFCGGFRGKFIGAPFKRLEDKQLHSSPLLLEPMTDPQPLIRTSSENDVMNEVDIAQFLILWDRAPEQYILTPKYIFRLSWDHEKNMPILSTSSNK
jgi:hypothetical protein